MAEDRIDIIIAARNQLHAGFAAAQRQLAAFSQSVNSATGTGLQNTLNILGAISKTRVAADAVRLVMAGLRGDFAAADEVAQRLPFGIGEAYRSAKALGLELTGWGREIKAAEAAVAELDKQLAAQQKRLEAARKLWGPSDGAPGGGETTEARIRRELELSAFSAADQAVRALQYAAREAQDKLFREWVAAGQHNPERFMALWNALTQTYENKLRELRAKQAEERERAAEKEAEELRRQEERRVASAARAEAEVRQTRLRLLGDDLGAEKARLAEYYRERIAAAQSAAEVAALREMEALEGIELERRRQLNELEKALPAPRTQAATMLGERFSGLAVQQRAAHEEARRRKEEEIAAYAKQQVELLMQVKDALTNAGGEQGVYVLRLN